jgi:diguanylate cyclase
MEKPEDVNQRCAKRAIALMEERGIPPTPENYAVWFHYAMGRNRELVMEVDKIFENKIRFTAETTNFIYNKYVAVTNTQKAIDDTANSAQKVLQEVLKAVDNFSGETKSYNQNVDNYLQDIGEKFSDDSVKGIVRELVQKTVTLKESGEKINARLEASTKEIQTLRQNLQEVTAESQRDFLTGVYTRKTFESMFKEYEAAAREKKSELCLLMIDIDHFKRFNDKFGHLLGDEVLKIVSRTLTDTLKGRDVVGRFGGEEFIVMLPETPIDGAVKVAEMIRQAIASRELKRRDTGDVYGSITVSMGVARYRLEKDNMTSLIKRADEALYRAKRAGRNQVSRE